MPWHEPTNPHQNPVRRKMYVPILLYSMPPQQRWIFNGTKQCTLSRIAAGKEETTTLVHFNTQHQV